MVLRLLAVEEIPDRSIVYGEQAKYKFTGKERDVETGYDYFGARYYNAKIGRWLSTDPLADKYPGWSPYNYVMNNPMRLIDPDGTEIWVQYWDYDDNGYPTLKASYQYRNGKLYDTKGKEYVGNNKFILNTKKTLNNLYALGNRKISRVLKELETNDFKNTINNNQVGNSKVYLNRSDGTNSNEGKPVDGNIIFQDDGFPDLDKCDWSYEAILGHELLHTYDFNMGNMKGWQNDKEKANIEDRPHEVRAVKFENLIRNKQGMKNYRTTYDGRKVDFNKDKIRK